MLFRQLFDPASSTFTYLLASQKNDSALLIDPVLEQIGLYQLLLKQFGLTLTMTIDTHTHADHVTASGKLRELYGSDIVMGNTTKAKGTTRLVADGEMIKIDPLIQLQALYTPGHTNDCFSYHCKDRVFTGDTLLIRGSGRTDFQEGDPKQQFHSIMTKLFTLPTETLVYPGHDYKVITHSTIGEERKFNPRLQVTNADEYAHIMNNLNLPRPKLMDIAVPANLNCGLSFHPE